MKINQGYTRAGASKSFKLTRVMLRLRYFNAAYLKV